MAGTIRFAHRGSGRLTQDPDGDGFTNLDEWQFHTNPTDKSSHPDYLTKLKMKSFTREPFG